MPKKENMQIIEHNVETNEIVVRALSDEEIALLKSEAEVYNNWKQQQQLIKEAAISKLVKLGLTEAEIQALAG